VREGQIGRELAYAFDFYQGLSPVMYLSYDREAFYSTDDRDLRITFDDDVRWRTHDLDLDVAPSGEEVLARGGSILEVKAAGSMPLWLADTLNELAVFPTGFSKYGRAYQMMNGTKEALSA
jgi:SPX domain protein involved in polyphosphate accumulation